MKTCPTCHEILPDEAKFCPVDGTSLSSVTSDPLLGSVIADRYLLKECIGQGSSGIIYRAEHTTLGKPLAVKLIHDHLSKDPEVVSRFEEESASLAKLKSEHIVKYSDLGKTADGRFFMVMEFFEGETLSSVLSSDGKMGEERSVKILEQVGEALGEAHGLGFVHRDIRPRNILLVKSEGGQEFVKLLDFGLSRLVEPRKGAQQGSSVGDPRYMSPEQASKGAAMDQRSDIYSLAILAYEMVTGNPPFVGAGTFDILAKHREAQPVAIREKVSEISKHFADAVNLALSKKPKERYPKVIRFINALTGKAPVALSRETATRSAVTAAPAKKVSEQAKRKVIEEARRKATAEAKRRAEEARKKRAAAEAKKREAEQAAARLSETSKAAKGAAAVLSPAAEKAKPEVDEAPPLPADEPEANEEVQEPTVEEASPPPAVSPAVGGSQPALERPALEPLPAPPPLPPEVLPEEPSEKPKQQQGHHPPNDPSESGVWFAEGLAAEQSLASQSKSGPLPAIYDDLVEEEQSRTAMMPLMIIGGVVGIAALVLFIFIYVLGGDKEAGKISKAMAAAPLLMDQGIVDPPAAPADPAKEPQNDAGVEPAGDDPTKAGALGEEKPAAAVAAAPNEKKPEPPKPEPPVAKPEPKPEPVAAKPKPEPVVAKKPAPRPRPVAKPKPKPKPRPKPRPRPRPRPVAKPKKIAGDAKVHVKAGRDALLKGSYSAATAEFKKAVAISSRNADAHAGMGEVAFELGSYAKAEKSLRKAVRYNPRKAAYQVLLGHVVFKLGKYKKAVDYYKKALKLSPGNAAAKRGLAAAEKRM